MPDALRRAIRTFAQAFVGVVALQLVAVSAGYANGTWVPDVDWAKRLAMSAFAAGATALVTWIHNYLEDAGDVPSVLKAQASSGVDPVTTDPVK